MAVYAGRPVTRGAGEETATLHAPIADPAPLGLAAFAGTTMMLSAVNAGWVDAKVVPAVLGMALFYGGAAQLLAGMWEFRRNNTFAAAAFSSFGAFWLAFWAFEQFYADKIPAAQAGNAVGLFLLAWAIFTTYMIIASLRVSVAVATVFVLLAATFWFLAFGEFETSKNLTKVGGYVGIVTAAVAWYTAFAGVVNETWKRTILPVGHTAPPAAAIGKTEPTETAG
ncbi:MAG TPA: acetate uptake transporter [Thermoleophilaceae bacterium]